LILSNASKTLTGKAKVLRTGTDSLTGQLLRTGGIFLFASPAFNQFI